MQDRYAGDIGDYVKLALLRALSPGRRLGLAWFKTPDESHNKDGRHVGYLDRPDRCRELDPELFDHLSQVVSQGQRSIEMLRPVLPADSVWHERRLADPRERGGWWRSLVETLGAADLIFLDPDNGLAPVGLTRGSKKSIKSIFWDEVSQLRRPGRALLLYHHQTRAKGGHQAEGVAIARRLLVEGAERVLVLRARPWSPRLFILIDGDHELENRARLFAGRWSAHVSIVDVDSFDERGTTSSAQPPHPISAVIDLGSAAEAAESLLRTGRYASMEELVRAAVRAFAAQSQLDVSPFGGADMVGSDLALVLDAASFAAERHRKQRRKDVDASPYINHPLALASILAKEGGVTDSITIAAALLHDVVEDTETTPEELRERFGDEVASVVAEVTDDKALPKHVRKQLQVEKAASKSDRAKLVKLADKISNLRDIAATPPADWDLDRRQAYFDWSRQVVAGLRGVNPALELAFERAFDNRPDEEHGLGASVAAGG